MSPLPTITGIRVVYTMALFAKLLLNFTNHPAKVPPAESRKHAVRPRHRFCQDDELAPALRCCVVHAIARQVDGPRPHERCELVCAEQRLKVPVPGDVSDFNIGAGSRENYRWL